MEAEVNPVGVFLSSFFVSAFAGLAALLRSVSPLTVKTVSSALLNSGLLGLAISLLWYVKYKDNLYFLIGCCAVAGLGGMTTVDFFLKAMQGGGFKISLSQNGVMQMKEDDKNDKA